MCKLADADLAILADRQVRLIKTYATVKATCWFFNYSMIEVDHWQANVCQGLEVDILEMPPVRDPWAGLIAWTH